MSHPGYNDCYFDDIRDTDRISQGEYLLTKEIILDFANQWDPMVFHTDEELAKSSPHRGLITPGTLLMAVSYTHLTLPTTPYV